jgi:hypothetical protein
VGVETIGWPAYLLREAPDPRARDAALGLLVAAGWPLPLLVEWAACGILLELYDPADDIPRGAAIVAAAGDGVYELRAWAATINVGDGTVAGRLVRAIGDALRRSGCRRVVASVGDADLHRLTLLLEAGFRVVGVERDAPIASGGRSCDRSRDLVWMDQVL